MARSRTSGTAAHRAGRRPLVLEPFIKRHSKAMAVIGGLIVLFTFLIKDGLEEKWKDQASAIESARYFQDIRSDLDIALITLYRQTLAQVSRQTVAEMGPDTNHDLEGTADSYANLKSFALIEVDYADFYLTRYKRYIQSLRELTRRFPTLSGINTQLDAADKTAATLDLKVAKFDRSELRLSVGQPHLDEFLKHMPAVDSDLHLAQEVILECDTNDAALRSIGAKLLSQADVIREDNEKKSRWAWWGAAFLYTLGLALTLLGRLYDVSIPGE